MQNGESGGINMGKPGGELVVQNQAREETWGDDTMESMEVGQSNLKRRRRNIETTLGQTKEIADRNFLLENEDRNEENREGDQHMAGEQKSIKLIEEAVGSKNEIVAGTPMGARHTS